MQQKSDGKLSEILNMLESNAMTRERFDGTMERASMGLAMLVKGFV